MENAQSKRKRSYPEATDMKSMQFVQLWVFLSIPLSVFHPWLITHSWRMISSQPEAASSWTQDRQFLHFQGFNTRTVTGLCQNGSQNQLTDCSISLKNQTFLEKSLRCKLTVEKDTWVTGEPAFVTVEIENISYENLDTAVRSSFRLERKSNLESEESSNEEELPYHQRHYGCPIDITRKGSPRNANEHSRLLLAAGESLTFKVDITRLPWGKLVRSAWPSESLYALVPEGRYNVYLNIEIEDTTSRFSDTDTGIPLPAKRILSDKSAITIIKKN
ncbi:MAG TPA: hypothetical protein PLS70_17830, partial [Acidobacteriota bacterium]|nr:hypothetical protein [Acidobacteriota bacterium]